MRWLKPAVLLLLLAVPARGQDAARGLTAVSGIKVGHFTLAERPTGCTAILTEAGATAGVDVRGGAPGTRETDLLKPVNTVEQVHAIVLSGGSAFGLDAATGVVRYLEEKGVGFDVGVAKVPIVPSAILFDLGFGGSASIRPTADCGYRAAQAATAGPVAEGNVGAGAGATVGKSAGPARAMKAGIGTASITRDGRPGRRGAGGGERGRRHHRSRHRPRGGRRAHPGRQGAGRRALDRAHRAVRHAATTRRGAGRAGQNTTIGVVATNAVLTKAQAQKVAQMAHDGLARAISPAHTPFDGDTIFALATGTRPGEASVGMIGAMAAEVMADAILRAASEATGLGGYPAARDLAAAPAK